MLTATKRDTSEDIKRAVHNNCKFLNRKPELLVQFNEYLTSIAKDLLKNNELLSSGIIKVTYEPSKETKYSHYVSGKIQLSIYDNEKRYEHESPSYLSSINIEECFNNCGIAVLFDCTNGHTEKIDRELIRTLIRLGEEVAEVHKYSVALYTVNTKMQTRLVDYLHKNYKLLNTYNNRRMGSEIAIYSKELS